MERQLYHELVSGHRENKYILLFIYLFFFAYDASFCSTVLNKNVYGTYEVLVLYTQGTYLHGAYVGVYIALMLFLCYLHSTDMRYL